MWTNPQVSVYLFTFTKNVFKRKHRSLRSGILNYYVVITLGSFSDFFVKGWKHIWFYMSVHKNQ